MNIIAHSLVNLYSRETRFLGKSLVSSVVLLCLAGLPLTPSRMYAESLALRHVVNLEFGGMSSAATYDRYLNNDEPRPHKVETTTTTGGEGAARYTFFFKPVQDRPEAPPALQTFYAHPSKMVGWLSLQPDLRSANVHSDPDLQYQRSTTTAQNIQRGGLGIEYYLMHNTGVLLQVSSEARDGKTHTQYTAFASQNQGEGEQTDLRRTYTFGVSHYLSERCNLQLRYARLDFGYEAHEKSWLQDRPILATDSYWRDAADGRHLTLRGEYILNNAVGIRGQYSSWDRSTRADFWSIYANNFPNGASSARIDVTGDEYETLISWYANQKTTIQAGGSYAVEYSDQNYQDTDRIDEYDWTRLGCNAGIWRYLTPRFAFGFSYEFVHQRGAVLIWYPHSASAPRTTYDTGTDVHTFHIQLNARF